MNDYLTTLNDNRCMTDKRHDPDNYYDIVNADRLRLINKWLPLALPKTVIDVGAGFGDFLRFLHKQKWTTQGIEPSSLSTEDKKRNKKVGIITGSIYRPKNLKLKRASLVTLFNVLEHLADPEKAIENVKEYLLAPNGIIVATVPNEYNPLQQILKLHVPVEKENFFLSKDHLHYWRQEAFIAFLKDKCNLGILDATADFPMEMIALMGDNYVAHPELGHKAHLKRVRFEKALAGNETFKDRLYAAFYNVGIGRNVTVVCR